MQKLISFLFRNYTIFLFLTLQLVAFIFIQQSNSYTRTTFINSTSAISGGILERYHNAQEFANLKKTNQILAEENARLRSTAKSSYFSIFNVTDTVVDTLYYQQYQYIAAKVVNSTYTYLNNNITINRGSKHGIEKGMGVISAKGVIGKVKDVSTNYSVVYPIINQRGQVTGRIKNSGYFGQISWDGFNYNRVQLNRMQRHVTFNIGDTVVSDARSEIFPTGVPIGIISSSTLDNETQFYTLELDLILDYANIEYVYVVKDLMKHERKNLEEKALEDE